MRALAFVFLLILSGCNACGPMVFDALDDPKVLPNPQPIEAISGLSAVRCRLCHPAIYDEWSRSLMAKAAVEPIFLQVRARDHKRWMCGRCHYPLNAQEPRLTVGLLNVQPLVPKQSPNPNFDPALHREGVTCAVCHLSAKAANHPEPAPADASPAVWTGALRAGAVPPHPVRQTAGLGSEGRMCARCHQFDPPFTDLSRPAADTMREYAEYRAKGGSQSCLSCHMPKIKRPVVRGGPAIEGHDHRFPGVLDRPLLQRSLGLALKRIDGGLTAQIENRAGHRVPTGEPSRVLVLDVELRAQDERIAIRQLQFLRSMDTETMWDRFDNSLGVLEKRALPLQFSSIERARADRAVARLRMLRYASDHPDRALLQADPAQNGARSLQMETLVATASVSLH